MNGSSRNESNRSFFKRSVDEQKTIILIIDEGQKLPRFCMEILREFLNFETNEHKLLQIVIFAQKEFDAVLDQQANVKDRINLYHQLEPLDFSDTRQMILFRIRKSGGGGGKKSFFSFSAMWAIYRMTDGYPRKIVNLCHQVLLAMIIQNRTRAGWSLVRSCARRTAGESISVRRRIPVKSLLALVACALVVGFFSDRLFTFVSPKMGDFRPVETTADLAMTPAVSAAYDRTGTPSVVKAPADDRMTETQEQAFQVSSVAAPEIISDKTTEDDAKTVASLNRNDRIDPPLILGSVALESGETLWRLIEKAYGFCDPDRMRLVLKANPGIKNPDRINAGQSIVIPAVSVDIKRPTGTFWWVKLDEAETLDSAIDLMRDRAGNGVSPRLVPYWDLKRLRFFVLLRTYFKNEDDAARHLQLLPEETGRSGNVAVVMGCRYRFLCRSVYKTETLIPYSGNRVS